MKPRTKVVLVLVVLLFIGLIVGICLLLFWSGSYIKPAVNSTTEGTSSVAPRQFNTDAGFFNTTQAPKPASQSIWFEQVLDHFNSSDKSKWKQFLTEQRYWINAEYFNWSGPVILGIGGEEEETGSAIFEPCLIRQLAKELGALMVVLEHRFYGQSRPTPDASEQNLRFLSMDQAVADLVNFRNFIHSSLILSNRNKWVAIGCSYPGTLAALLRLRHPESFHAAVASSAPMKFELEYREFNQIVNRVLKLHYAECAKELGQAMSAVNSMLETEEGRAHLSALLENAFDDLEIKNNAYLLLDSIATTWATAVQYNSNKTPRVQELCKTMTSSSLGEPLQRLVNIMLEDLYQKTQSEHQVEGFPWSLMEETNYNRIWSYQVCFDFGLMYTLHPVDWPLGADLSLDFSLSDCRANFETFSVEKLEHRLQKYNQEIGGDNYKGTRVVFVCGDRDPWYKSGLTSAPNPQTNISVIEGASHCLDVYGHHDGNHLKHNHAIAQIKQQIKKYIQE